MGPSTLNHKFVFCVKYLNLWDNSDQIHLTPIASPANAFNTITLPLTSYQLDGHSPHLFPPPCPTILPSYMNFRLTPIQPSPPPPSSMTSSSPIKILPFPHNIRIISQISHVTFISSFSAPLVLFISPLIQFSPCSVSLLPTSTNFYAPFIKYRYLHCTP